MARDLPAAWRRRDFTVCVHGRRLVLERAAGVLKLCRNRIMRARFACHAAADPAAATAAEPAGATAAVASAC